MEDKRFIHVLNDPKFRTGPKRPRKVKIDKRFQSMFKGNQFNSKHTVDKRGRPVNRTSAEYLKQYYELSSEESSAESGTEVEESSSKSNLVDKTGKPHNVQSDEDQNDLKTKQKSNKVSKKDSLESSITVKKAGKSNKAQNDEEKVKQKKKVSKKSSLESQEVDKKTKKSVEVSQGEENETEQGAQDLNKKHKSDKKISKKIKERLHDLSVDYIRGEANLFSESSSDDEESESESVDDSIEHQWGELDNDAEKIEEATYRLAVCNMDWDRIRAVDLMVLFNSFLPPGGTIESVVIYPSEFGKARMAEEDVKGPIELVEHNEEEETEEGSKYHMEKLRQYQLNRLKYYYAVVTFDSVNSADKIYTECDGVEYESSATKLDLRFIPDDMTFDEEPKDTCEKLPELNKYQPRFFTTTALQQAKVDLTWDETDPDRVEFTQKLNSGKFDDISDADLQKYIAVTSDEDSNDEVEKNGNDSDNEDVIKKYRKLLQEIEEQEKKKEDQDVAMEVQWNPGLKEETEKLVKKKLKEDEEKTPFQKYLDKRKEKRKEKKKQKKSGDSAENDSSKDDSDIPSDVDMSNPYFAEEFDKPEFKKKKDKKPKQNSEEVDEQKNAELELLLMNEDGDNNRHFSLKKIQDKEKDSKKKKRKNKNVQEETAEDNFQVNVNDERFSALFTTSGFNIDTTDPNYKKTKGMEALISEKIRRIKDTDEPAVKKPKIDKNKAELTVLTNSLKRKLKK